MCSSFILLITPFYLPSQQDVLIVVCFSQQLHFNLVFIKYPVSSLSQKSNARDIDPSISTFTICEQIGIIIIGFE